MVTFLQGKLPAVLYRKGKKDPVFVFEKRQLQTDDKKLIALLKKAGYQTVEDVTAAAEAQAAADDEKAKGPRFVQQD